MVRLNDNKEIVDAIKEVKYLDKQYRSNYTHSQFNNSAYRSKKTVSHTLQRVAASKIDSIFTQSLVAMGSAVATYVGQNYGAGEIERINKGVNQAMLVSVALAIVYYEYSQ